MQIRKKLQRTFVHNWKPKMACLLAAVLVWLLVYKLVKAGETPVWEVNEVLTTQPE